MTIFEKTRELGEMLRDCDEMKAYKDAEIAQQQDETAQEEMKKFNMNRINLARDMQNGKISREDAVAANEKAYAELLENAPLIREFMQAKEKFDAVVTQVNNIINFYITGSTGGCTHDCSSCGGCN